MADMGTNDHPIMTPENIHIDRPVYTHSSILAEYEGSPNIEPSTIKSRCRHCCRARRCVQCMLTAFPFVHNLAGYSIRKDLPNDIVAGLTIGIMHIPQALLVKIIPIGIMHIPQAFPFIHNLAGNSIRKDLPNDIVAGLTIGIMHIPQGMAYGMLASLTPVYGLYSSIFPVLIYFFLGTSKHISIGTSAVTTLMVGAACDKGYAIFANKSSLPNGGPTNVGLPYLGPTHTNVDMLRLLLVLAITFASGAIQCAMGLCRLGVIATYLSDPLIGGFTTGAAFHVVSSQLSYIFGVTVQRYSGPLKFFYLLIEVFSEIPRANPVTITTALVAIVIMFVVKVLVNGRCRDRLKMPVPIELIILILATIISYFAKFHQHFGVAVVGEIPRGLPHPIIPGFRYLPPLLGDTVSLAIVGFAISISLAKLFAKKHNYEIDANQELVSYGVGNMFSSFFGCFFTSGALARSTVQESAGGRTQVAGMVSCGLLVVVLFAVGPLFDALPNCILGAIIVVNLKGLFGQFGTLPSLWRICKYDFSVWLVTMVATVILDIDWGLLTGILFSIVTVLWRSRRSPCCILGRLPGTDIYKDVKRYNSAEGIPGIQIFQFGSPIYYANADYFCTEAYRKIGINPRGRKTQVCCTTKGVGKRVGLRKRLRKHRHPIITNEKDSETRELTPVTPPPDNTLYPAVRFNDDVAYRSSSNINVDAPIADIVIDCSLVAYVDKMGIDALLQVVSEYEAIDMTVYLASVNDSVYDSLKVAEFFHKFSEGQVMVCVHDAVTRILSIPACLDALDLTKEAYSDNNTDTETQTNPESNAT